MSDQTTGGPGRIVVGVDGSASSLDALEWAAAQAELTGLPLHVVTAWRRPIEYSVGAMYAENFDPEGGARQMLDETLEPLHRDHPALEVSHEVIEGHPAPILVDAARDANLLVVGSRGHGAFVGMLLGSVSSHCVAHAACPVVVLHHPHELEEA